MALAARLERLRQRTHAHMSALPDNHPKPAALQRGHLAAATQLFVPLLSLSRYPFNFCSDQQTAKDVAAEFFAQGKFWDREWDL
jgi:hypothetical protein